MTDFDADALGDVYRAGLTAEKSGDREAAAKAYLKCLEIDPSDHVGAEIRLAGMGVRDAPASAGNAYVATLFDQHAEDFEDILVRQLRYRVPDMAAEILRRRGARFDRLLDLGCGTGLGGEALSDLCNSMVGVDLSEEMVRISGEKDIYDRLFVAEAVAFLRSDHAEAGYDLVLATDVVPYLGALEDLFGAVANCLVAGGTFAFSTETMSEDALKGRPFAVGTAQRFHHSESYVRKILSDHGFSIEQLNAITVRLQEGAPAPGHLVVARTGT